jgi:hypothetical protein
MEIGTSSINWARLSRFYLKTETESSLQNAVFLNKNRIVDNVKKHNTVFVFMYHRHKLLDLICYD